jgi:hypothetical protein
MLHNNLLLVSWVIAVFPTMLDKIAGGYFENSYYRKKSG